MTSSSANRTPTNEQLAVISAEHTSMVVTAAAGAGKTYVLVERYLKHVLQDGYRPDQILTITFTRKAAAEMKRRIVDALRDLGRLDEAQVAETGPVQTIHSFCERLLRENALEAGLDPKFEVMTEAQSLRLLEACIRETLGSSMEEMPQAERLLRELAGQRTNNDRSSPYAVLEDGLRRTLAELRGSGATVSDLTNIANPLGLRHAWERGMLDAAPAGVREEFANVVAEDFHERLKAAYKAAGQRMPRYVAARPDLEAEEEALEPSCGLLQLAVDAWGRLEAAMTRIQRMDFNSLEARAVFLLENSRAARARIGNQYKVVMVDEAQDVNPIQHRLLGAMNLQCEMMVGDAQQSIYGFRQADVSLFRAKERDTASLRLSRNFRSDPGILNFVDLVFGSLWGSEYTQMSEATASEEDVFGSTEPKSFDGVELWDHPGDEDVALTSMYLKEVLDEKRCAFGDVAVLVRHSYFALKLLNRLERDGIPARIAGGSEKFYARLEVRDLANTLRSLGDPYDDLSLLATLRSPVCGVSLDTVAELALKSPVVEALADHEPSVDADAEKLAEFNRWFMPLKEYADRLPAWEVLSILFAESGYLASLARRRNRDQLLANVRKLLMLATQEPELGPVEYAERIREIQMLRHKEGDAPATEEKADVVTIMTIHKSKGLEFPVVIVPEMHFQLSGRSRSVEVHARARPPLIATKFGRRQSIFHAWLESERKTREAEEELRILYVALTRAKHRLCVGVASNTKRDCLAKRLAGVIGYGKRAPEEFKVRGGEG